VVIPRVFDLIHTRNPGAAWGMFGSHPHWLSLVSLVMLVLLVVFRRHVLDDSTSHRIAYGLLLAGIIGNLIDRFKYGAVVDFLDFHIIRWPTFNVAHRSGNLYSVLHAQAAAFRRSAVSFHLRPAPPEPQPPSPATRP
jgi:signal peptidase II